MTGQIAVKAVAIFMSWISNKESTRKTSEIPHWEILYRKAGRGLNTTLNDKASKWNIRVYH